MSPRPRLLRALGSSRRGRSGVAGPGDPTTEPPSAAAGTDGRPTATYAAVLDGRHLWLGVDRPGTPALRDACSGRVVVAAAEAVDAVDPGRFPAVLRLPEAPHAELQAVLVTPDGTTATPVLAGPGGGGRVPVSPDGHHRWTTYRADDGSLRLRADEVPDALVLQEISTGAGTVVLRCEPPAPLALLGGPDGDTVAAIDGSDDELGRTVLTPAHLATLPAGRVKVVEAADHRPVRRRADSLAGPGRAAPLPELIDADGSPVLRLRWSPEGMLEAEVLTGEPAGDAVA